MKVCPRCKERPSIRNSKKNYAPYCIECQSVYWLERRQARLDLVSKAKSKPCADCGIEYPHYVMDLDHVTDDKYSNVSAMLSYSIDRLVKEIEKCEVVCSNCHRQRTYQRAHSPVA